MTTIAAYIDVGGKVAIAADRQWSNRVRFVGEPKIRRFGHLVVGLSGPSVVLGFEGKPGGYNATEDGVAKFAADFRAFFVTHGHTKVGDGGTNNAPAYALAVYPGAIRLVDFDGGILKPIDYAAIGSGHDIAYGALHVVRVMGFNARAAVEVALAAAIAHDPWTGGPPSVWVESEGTIEDLDVVCERIRAREDEDRKRAALAAEADLLGGVPSAGKDQLLATLRARGIVSEDATATHRCKGCGALWRLWGRGEAHPGSEPSWSLVSSTCGPCCDNVPMLDQIEPLP